LGIYWALPKSERKFFNEFASAKGSDRERILKMVPKDQVHLYQAVWKNIDEGTLAYPGSDKTTEEAYLTQRFYQLEGYFDQNPLPPVSWVGYHPGVEMDDIKVKYVDELGKDIHDFGLWESQLRRVARQPYLEGSTAFLHEEMYVSRSLMYSQMKKMFKVGQSVPWTSVHQSNIAETRANVYYEDTRDSEILPRVRGYFD
jgi:hypothetical protein